MSVLKSGVHFWVRSADQQETDQHATHLLDLLKNLLTGKMFKLFYSKLVIYNQNRPIYLIFALHFRKLFGAYVPLIRHKHEHEIVAWQICLCLCLMQANLCIPAIYVLLDF